MRWADENIHASTAGDEHPEPIGVVNDSRLIADTKRLRWTADNYFTSHMRQIVFYSLALDAADDPPIDSSAPASKLGNSLHSYFDNAVGAWLYDQYAVYEDPTISAPALGVARDGLGVASGGLSPEGFLYGSSLGTLHHALLALYTAGHRDPRVLGPQIRLIDSAYWDKLVDGVLHSIVGEPQLVPGEEYLGPVYQLAAYGDTQRFWLMPDFSQMFTSLAIYDNAKSNTKRLDKERWLAINAVEGTAPGLAKRVGNIWGNSTASQSLLYFMALDPDAKPPVDPRPSMPPSFYDPAIGRFIARTAWGPSGNMFDYKCTWESISHQDGDCNQFEFFRKGEWLVKERTGYANDVAVLTSEYHNTLAIQNGTGGGAAKPKNLQWFEEESWARGGQFTLGVNQGDPTSIVSEGAGWTYAQGDATKLYNRIAGGRRDDAIDVAHASRSIVWLKPDVIVVYDRATTKSEKRFKRFHLVSGGDGEVHGDVATFTTPKGQKLFVRTLLPHGATIAASKATPFNQMAAGEPSRSKLVVEDASQPRDVRFLHVLEGADAGASATASSAIQSTAGTPFAGAAVGAFSAMFAVDLATTFTTTTYAVPSSATSHVVAGLVPGASYDVKLTSSGASTEITIAPGSAYKADSAGVIAFGRFAKP
jgi:hypothetical protein